MRRCYSNLRDWYWISERCNKWYQNFPGSWGVRLSEVDHSRTHLGSHLEVKFQSLSILDPFSVGFSHSLFGFLEDMAEVNQATVKNMNIH